VVAQGTNLAIRDFTSSDPYVVVRLADKSAKTKVINSCLNPVWNEEMVFSVREPLGIIKFVSCHVSLAHRFPFRIKEPD
uniref:C2 domain-containing protein n=1 Tax=Aegilops tauschii subsp. strangulata TaxID=200361 RepID=A0A453KI99_AEGTS